MRALKPIRFSALNRKLSVTLFASLPKPTYQPARKAISCQLVLGGELSRADATLLLVKQASHAARTKNYSRAIAIFDRLIALAPTKADCYNNRGLMHCALHQPEQALADYSQAIAINPMLDKAYNNRANLYATQHSWADALTDYDRAIDINPLNIRARLNQAITFKEIGDYEEALICLDIAMVFQPGNAALYAERGRIYHLDGDWNCAIADYKTALRLHSKHIQSNHNSMQPLARCTQDAALRSRVLKWLNALEPVA